MTINESREKAVLPRPHPDLSRKTQTETRLPNFLSLIPRHSPDKPHRLSSDSSSICVRVSVVPLVRALRTVIVQGPKMRNVGTNAERGLPTMAAEVLSNQSPPDSHTIVWGGGGKRSFCTRINFRQRYRRARVVRSFENRVRATREPTLRRSGRCQTWPTSCRKIDVVHGFSACLEREPLLVGLVLL